MLKACLRPVGGDESRGTPRIKHDRSEQRCGSLGGPRSGGTFPHASDVARSTALRAASLANGRSQGTSPSPDTAWACLLGYSRTPRRRAFRQLSRAAQLRRSKRAEHMTQRRTLRLKRIGWSILIVSALWFMGVGDEVVPRWLGKPLFQCLVPIGAGLLYRARQLEQPRAEELVAQDRRRPVVYLRPFAEDAAAKTRPLTSGPPLLALELRFARLARQIGPFVAVGNPARELPDLGAARFRLGDDWKARVAKLVEDAECVLLLAGSTEGVLWEAEALVLLKAPKKVVLLIPRTFRDRQRQALKPFLERWRSLTGVGLVVPARGECALTFSDSWKSEMHIPRRRRIEEWMNYGRPPSLPICLEAALRHRGYNVSLFRSNAPFVWIIFVLFVFAHVLVTAVIGMAIMLFCYA